MQRSIAAALMLSAATLSPALATAQSSGSETPNLDQVFRNRGACESTLKQIRNEARQTVKQNGGGGQTNALINRLANPVIKFVCTAASGQNGSDSGFKIVELPG